MGRDNTPLASCRKNISSYTVEVAAVQTLGEFHEAVGIMICFLSLLFNNFCDKDKVAAQSYLRFQALRVLILLHGITARPPFPRNTAHPFFTPPPPFFLILTPPQN